MGAHNVASIHHGLEIQPDITYNYMCACVFSAKQINHTPLARVIESWLDVGIYQHVITKLVSINFLKKNTNTTYV